MSVQNRKSNYFEMMNRAHKAHQEFHLIFAEYLKNDGRHKTEPPKVRQAREHFFSEYDRLWQNLLAPLIGSFQNDKSSAIDELIEFLDVDIPVFRCGYLKEYFLKRLTSVELLPRQQKRLLEIGMYLCTTNSIRREFRRWVNLLSLIADQEFVNRIETLDTFAARITLDKILKNRRDLHSL